MAKRTTIRFNDVEEADLERLKAQFQISDDSKAIKMSIEWVLSYIQNVTQIFFPPSYDVVLYKKIKSYERKRKVFDEKE